ncbi:hypothetical protein D3C71_1787950 [compost metagenome]
MLDRRKAGHHRADHALRGRVGRDELGIEGFQCLQLLVDTVVLGVRHGGGVKHVILMRPAAQLPAQELYFTNNDRRYDGLTFSLIKKILLHALF